MAPPDLVAEIREKRREKMLEVTRAGGLPIFHDTDGQLEEMVARLSELLGDHVEMKMMGMTVRLQSISAGRRNYLWMSSRQGDERYVCIIWPRPLFSDGVVHYATSETFINRVRMTIMMVSKDQLEFD